MSHSIPPPFPAICFCYLCLQRVQVWFHIGWQSLKPWRPTLLQMAEALDQPDLGLGFIHLISDLDTHADGRRTLWQAVESLDLSAVWTLDDYSLMTTQRPLDKIRAGQARVRRHVPPHSAVVWNGWQAEEEARQRELERRRTRSRGHMLSRYSGLHVFIELIEETTMYIQTD